jgi:hypothetical protein
MNNVYYVYIHRRGDNNEVFYVGKGKGNRIKQRDGRNIYWKNIVNKHGYTYEIVEKELSEDSAFDLEIELIKFYRESGHKLVNLRNGGEGGSWSDSQKELLIKEKKKANKGKKELDLNLGVSDDLYRLADILVAVSTNQLYKS